MLNQVRNFMTVLRTQGRIHGNDLAVATDLRHSETLVKSPKLLPVDGKQLSKRLIVLI